MEAKGRAAETAHRNAAWLAWQTASLTAFAFHAPAKMPRLKSLTGEKRQRQAQTPEQMKAVFAAWAGR